MFDPLSRMECGKLARLPSDSITAGHMILFEAALPEPDFKVAVNF